MRSLTKSQIQLINGMKLSDKDKKFVRKIARFVNNKNEYLKTEQAITDPNDPSGRNGVQYAIIFAFSHISIYDENHLGKITMDIYFFNKDFVSYEICFNGKKDSYPNYIWFTNELGRLIYE